MAFGLASWAQVAILFPRGRLWNRRMVEIRTYEVGPLKLADEW